jgi:CO/xanthine dehydrogenase FAD-binding subunit
VLQAFDYVAPQSVTEAVTLLSQNGNGARVLAGGTDLLVQMREARIKTSLIVDIKHIPEANELTYDPDDGLRLGAAVPCIRIYSDPAVAAAYPGLIDAVSMIGGVQIQGRATVGGNLGNASPAADAIPPLIVHRATCQIAGPGGSRQVPVEDFCTGPGQTVLQQGEFLVALHLPPPTPGFGAHYLRFIPRNEMDIAVAGVGASVMLDGSGTIQAARVALAAVAPTPLLVAEAGEALVGRQVSDKAAREAAIEEAAEIARDAARPISDMRGTAAQRKHLSLVLTRRALHKAIERAAKTLGEA